MSCENTGYKSCDSHVCPLAASIFILKSNYLTNMILNSHELLYNEEKSTIEIGHDYDWFDIIE